MTRRSDEDPKKSELLLVQEFILEGDRLFQQKQWEAAQQNYERAVGLQPTLISGLCKLGKVALNQQRWDGAARWFERALELNSQSHLANYGLAEVSIGREDWSAAADRLARTIDLEPRFLETVCLNLGKVLQKMRRWDEAIVAYCMALRCEKKSEGYSQLAITLCRRAESELQT